MSHEVKNKCREMTGLINYHHVKLLHVVILDLKGVVPTIYQNFFWIIDISHHVVDFKQKIVHHLTLMTEEIKMTIEGVANEKKIEWHLEILDENEI